MFDKKNYVIKKYVTIITRNIIVELILNERMIVYSD